MCVRYTELYTLNTELDGFGVYLPRQIVYGILSGSKIGRMSNFRRHEHQRRIDYFNFIEILMTGIPGMVSQNYNNISREYLFAAANSIIHS